MIRDEQKRTKESRTEIARGLKRLKDEYPFPKFQAMAYDLTGYVVKPYSDRCELTLHKAICIKKTIKPLVKDRFEWGVCGAYNMKAVQTIKYKGNFTYNLLKKIVASAKQLKEK